MKLSRQSMGLAIRAARDAAKLSLVDLEGITGIDKSALSRSENGLRAVEFAEAILLAEAFKISIEQLRKLAETFESEGIAGESDRLAQDLNRIRRLALQAAIELRVGE